MASRDAARNEAELRKLLADNRTKLDRLAEKLMEKEILDSDEVDALIREGGGAVATA